MENKIWGYKKYALRNLFSSVWAVEHFLILDSNVIYHLCKILKNNAN